MSQERIYEIAGLRVRVIVPEGQVISEGAILTGFRVSGGYDHTMELTVTDRLDAPAGELIHKDPGKRIYSFGEHRLRFMGAVEQSLDGAYLRIDRVGQRSMVQVLRSAIPCGITSKLLLDTLEAEHLVNQSGGFLLHASVIDYGGTGILFTAPCGTGKSTQARLWQQLRGAKQVNGDRAAVRGGTVWGIPFCGSSGIAHKGMLPIGAIVYLSQAPQTTIRRLSDLEAFRRLWEGCSVNVWDPEDMDRCAEAVTRTVSAVPIYHLACTPDETAVRALEQEVGI